MFLLIPTLDSVQIRSRVIVMSTGHAELLRSHGLQVTAQRLAVLRAVATRPHATVETVADAARTEIGAISRQAVYDALGALVDQGLVRRIQPIGSPARYEDRAGDNHHHLVCRACGTVVDIDCAVGHAPCLTPADHHGYEIDEAEVVYWGRCPACRSATTAASATTSRTATSRTATSRTATSATRATRTTKGTS